ncbi:MAG: hypothetical protein Kow0090_21520 [Myxococcota bacterium]
MKIKLVVLFVILVFAALSSCMDLSEAERGFGVSSNVEDWRDEIIYQIMVDRFADGDKSNNYNVEEGALTAYQGGDWQGIIDRLDYLEELGVTTLWISPVVKNVEEDAGVFSYHGYWTQSFVETNPHFGDLYKLREMVNACHERGIKVILDIVVNHIGQLFYYDINLNGRPDETLSGSGYSSNLSRTTEWDPDFNSRGIQAATSLGESGLAPLVWVYNPEINRIPPFPQEFQNPDWYNRKGRVTDWNIVEQTEQGDFPGGLKDLKTTNPAVRKKLIEVMSYWIKAADFDGFRIDTLKHVEHGFWQEFCPAIRKFCKNIGKEKFLMFGEAFDGDDAKIGSYTFNGEVDSVFYFSQKFQVINGVLINNNPTKEIENLWSNRLPHLNPEAPKHYYTLSHQDGAGVPPWQALVNFIDNHDIPRFLYDAKLNSNIGDKEAALRNALFFLLTIDGIPCIYYGTEQNFSGGNDPANREILWQSGYDTTNKTFKHIKHLIELRKKYPALSRGTISIRWSSERSGLSMEQDAGIFAFERNYNGETLLVVMNTHDTKFSETAITVDGIHYEMQTSFPAGTTLVNVFEDDDLNDTFMVGADGNLTLSVPPRGGKILVKLAQ